MFATEWIFTIFSSIIPIDQIDSVFDEFFKDSWLFLYRFVVHLLKIHEKPILENDNISEMMLPIKDFKPKSTFNKLLSNIPLFGKLFRTVSWSDIAKGAKEEVIDEKYLTMLMESYDVKNSRFKYTQRK